MIERQVYAPLGGVILRALGFGARGAEVVPVTAETPLPVALAADAQVSVAPVGLLKPFRATAILTRPSDTAAYAAGDLIAGSTTAASVTPLSFTVGRFDGATLINAAVLIHTVRVIARAGAPTIRPRVRAYGAAPFGGGGYPADNAVLTGATGALTADALALEQVLGDVSAWTQTSANAAFADIALAAPIPMVADGEGKIYALLEALNAGTPTSALRYDLVLRGLH